MKFFKAIAATLLSLLLITGCVKSTPNVGASKEEDTGVYLIVNNGVLPINMMHKTKYKDTNQDTYVIGFLSFNYYDCISVLDRKNNQLYFYNDLYRVDDYDYSNCGLDSCDDSIQIKTHKKIGIEFSRNGDKKIRIHFADDPYGDDIEHLVTYNSANVKINNTEEVAFDTIKEYPKESDKYKELTWFINNPYIKDADTNRGYLNSRDNIQSLYISISNLERNAKLSVNFEGTLLTFDRYLPFPKDMSLSGIEFNCSFWYSFNLEIEFFPVINMFNITITQA